MAAHYNIISLESQIFIGFQKVKSFGEQDLKKSACEIASAP